MREAAPARLGPQPGEVIDRSTSVPFQWNGRRYRAHPGDTIVSALAAAGEDVFSRSFKYHRPRGVLTADFHDPNCLVEVDGEPNVRGAHVLVREGMTVRGQNGWPSVRHDVKRIVALTSPFTGAGFYYKTFMSPRLLRPLYNRVLQTFSPGGHVDRGSREELFDKRFIFHDVVVAGGGPAGIEAAIAAANSGGRVLLVDEQHALGGHLRWGGPEELCILDDLRRRVATTEGIDVLTDAVVFGRYDHNWVGVLERTPIGPPRERLWKGRPGVLVVAPGLIERPYVFRGNDLPGVVLATGVRRLINLYAVRPGHRAVVVAGDPEGEFAARDLERAGVDVEFVSAAAAPRLRAAHGRSRIESVEFEGGARTRSDLLVIAVGWTSPTALASMAGQRAPFDPRLGRFVLAQAAADDVLATGGLVGDGSLDELRAHGRATGEEAARRALRRGEQPPVAPPALRSVARRSLFLGATDGIVDFHEDVHRRDVVAAAGEGYDSIELNKRYTTATMGLDQGKLSAVNTIAAMASATGREMSDVGTTTWRPPYVPVSLGALAGRRLAPVRITPMHEWHEAHGASFVRTGDWLRPDTYGDPSGEVLAVRNGVGLIDVTTLGKFELRGPDVPLLLEQVYVNRWLSLPVGGVRYGVMVAEDGAIFDDGVTGRLDDDRYLMSATSSGAERVRRWLERWLQAERPDWRITLRNVTDLYAAMNLAGPRSREVLAGVAEGVDLSPDGFPYMAVRPGRLADVDGFMWRIGFTGELAYELYVPAGHGRRVWEAVLEAGRDWGIRPFGVEAQRIMRIEKGHPVVGQDTDALTGPFAAGLGRLVKLDKPEMVGRPELAWQADHPDELAYRLMALQTVDPATVPAESCQLIDENGRIAGRITSSRFSPTLGRSVALALASPRIAREGAPVRVRLTSGRVVDANFLDGHAHLDPEGRRLRV
jgi:sarcosine oxidase, subunit alpha